MMQWVHLYAYKARITQPIGKSLKLQSMDCCFEPHCGRGFLLVWAFSKPLTLSVATDHPGNSNGGTSVWVRVTMTARLSMIHLFHPVRSCQILRFSNSQPSRTIRSVYYLVLHTESPGTPVEWKRPDEPAPMPTLPRQHFCSYGWNKDAAILILYSVYIWLSPSQNTSQIE